MSLVKMPDAVQSKGLFVNSKAVIVMHMKSMADIVTCEVREDILYNSYYTTVRCIRETWGLTLYCKIKIVNLSNPINIVHSKSK